MSHLIDLETVACESELHDGHIARTALSAINAAKTGSITQGQAKFIINNITKQFELAKDVPNRDSLFSLLKEIKKTNLLSL